VTVGSVDAQLTDLTVLREVITALTPLLPDLADKLMASAGKIDSIRISKFWAQPGPPRTATRPRTSNV
jgi:hypothetical protein